MHYSADKADKHSSVEGKKIKPSAKAKDKNLDLNNTLFLYQVVASTMYTSPIYQANDQNSWEKVKRREKTAWLVQYYKRWMAKCCLTRE